MLLSCSIPSEPYQFSLRRDRVPVARQAQIIRSLYVQSLFQCCFSVKFHLNILFRIAHNSAWRKLLALGTFDDVSFQPHRGCGHRVSAPRLQGERRGVRAQQNQVDPMAVPLASLHPVCTESNGKSGHTHTHTHTHTHHTFIYPFWTTTESGVN